MIGAQLKAWRERREFSKAEAARQVGVSRNSWIAYEAGRRPVPKTVELAICAVK
jgi:DNA-binding XRE family transcriptional regulator